MANRITEVSCYSLIISLNANELNSPAKWYRVMEWMRTKDSTMYWTQDVYFWHTINDKTINSEGGSNHCKNKYVPLDHPNMDPIPLHLTEGDFTTTDVENFNIPLINGQVIEIENQQ